MNTVKGKPSEKTGLLSDGIKKAPKTITSQLLDSPNFLFGCVAFCLGLIGDCLNIFQGTYLTLIGWNEGSVGLALSLMGFTSLLFQTIAGDIIDKTSSDRRYLLSIACIVTTFSALAILFVTNNHTSYMLYYITKIIQGLATTFIGPAIGALTMGYFGPKHFDANMARIILCSHIGTLVTAVLAGIFAYILYPDIKYSFLVLGFALILSLFFIRLLPQGDPNMGRGFHGEHEKDELDESGNIVNNNEHDDDTTASASTNISNPSSGEGPKAASYWVVFTDYKICILCMTGLFFHFANANVLLVLGEMMSKDDNNDGEIKRSAFPLIAGSITVAQVAMALTTKFSDYLTQEKNYGRKILFLLGLASLPLRCALIILWQNSGDYWLMSTQVLDGIGGGFFGLLHPYLVADITYGTGRFNVAMGLTGTFFGIGASLSNFLGQLVVQNFGHIASVYASLFISFLPIFLFSIFMPETLGLRGQIGDEIVASNYDTTKDNNKQEGTTSDKYQVDVIEVKIV